MGVQVAARALAGVVLFFTLLAVGQAPAQEVQKNALEQWPQATLAKAWVNAGLHCHDTLERQVIFYANLVRLNPALFERTLLPEYLEKAPEVPGKHFVSSLRETLSKLQPLGVLEQDEDLYKMAKDHATRSGKSGAVGHEGYEKRMDRFLGKKFNPTGENCAYGFNDPFIVLMQLLVDDKVPNFGHRKNILNPAFKKVGVSIRPHKVYHYNCVMEFGG